MVQSPVGNHGKTQCWGSLLRHHTKILVQVSRQSCVTTEPKAQYPSWIRKNRIIRHKIDQEKNTCLRIVLRDFCRTTVTHPAAMEIGVPVQAHDLTCSLLSETILTQPAFTYLEVDSAEIQAMVYALKERCLHQYDPRERMCTERMLPC